MGFWLDSLRFPSDWASEMNSSKSNNKIDEYCDMEGVYRQLENGLKPTIKTEYENLRSL